MIQTHHDGLLWSEQSTLSTTVFALKVEERQVICIDAAPIQSGESCP